VVLEIHECGKLRDHRVNNNYINSTKQNVFNLFNAYPFHYKYYIFVSNILSLSNKQKTKLKVREDLKIYFITFMEVKHITELINSKTLLKHVKAYTSQCNS
jgi:hypothetical protein